MISINVTWYVINLARNMFKYLIGKMRYLFISVLASKYCVKAKRNDCQTASKFHSFLFRQSSLFSLRLVYNYDIVT